ncbi:GntR family transcriptional regulator [Olivibacter sp. SDN3]|uniref:GntR family transcriptional regulator n=1 Tax=Olivibacter sp. SDN3 TaxID=2764720 RepID=UPI001650FA56|nr:GntR family transcriptional regulator [Olivibacter sp. SDN3]QNL48371.1 GntR family transcriptional regulator [Olivibacter sp. SDN3]
MKLHSDSKNKKPLHIQAEELIRDMIRKLPYAEGAYLPNELELAASLGISRTTLRQALNKMVYDGLLVRKKGAGTKVADKVISSKSNRWLSFSQEMKARGIPIKNYELLVSWVSPNEQVADFFKIKPTEKVLMLRRLRGNLHQPFVLFVSYFHPSIGFTGEENFIRPLYDIMEHDYNVRAQLSREEISAMAAGKELAVKLDIEEGSPVLCRRRLVYDQDQNPIEYNLGYYKAESFVLTFDSAR